MMKDHRERERDSTIPAALRLGWLSSWMQPCFKVYVGFVLITYSKTRRHGNDCHDGRHCTHSSLDTEGVAPRVSQEVEAVREDMGKSLYCGFCRKACKARQAGLGLSSWKNLSGPRCIAAVPSCLVGGLGWLGRRNIASWNVRVSYRRWLGVCTPEWLVCMWKAPSWVSYFLSLRTGSPPRGTLSS